jgi:hypothetical protein
MTRVVLHIDKLVLKGLQREDAADITAGLERELRARLSGSDATRLFPGDARFGRLHAGEIRLSADTQTENIGRALAERIVGF